MAYAPSTLNLPLPLTVSAYNGSSSVVLTTLGEPVIIPIPNGIGRMKTFYMRPGSGGPGAKVWWDPGSPSNFNYKSLKFKSEFITPAQRALLEIYEYTVPRACQVQWNGYNYYCKFTENGLIMGNYKFNLEQFHWAEFDLLIMQSI